MGEYQYYEFHTIDRALTVEERTEINTWSSRSEATATSVSFEYNYGDFRKDPEEVMFKYFDAMIYIAGWGTKQIMFRFPKALVNYDELKQFRIDDEAYYDGGVQVKKHGEFVLISIKQSDEEGYGWIEAGDSLLEIMPLRNDILEGDYRSLYLIWLKFVSEYIPDEDMDEEDQEEFYETLSPPLLGSEAQFHRPLNKFIDFFEIEDKLLLFTQQEMKRRGTERSTPEWENLIAKLSEEERNNILLKLINGEKGLSIFLKKRLMSLSPSKKETTTSEKRKTFREIWEQVKKH